MTTSATDPESQKGKSTESEGAKKLRALLGEVELTPEQTSDDIAPKSSRDRELVDDVPPHHGG
jgi:hypothetical protein